MQHCSCRTASLLSLNSTVFFLFHPYSMTISNTRSPSNANDSTLPQSNDNRIDFISELPMELVMANILPRIFDTDSTVIFSLDDPDSYFDVCSEWSRRIAFFGGDTITFSVGSNNPLTKRACRRLRVVSSCIKTLCMAPSSEEYIQGLIRCTEFRMVSKLQVTCKYYTFSSSSSPD